MPRMFGDIDFWNLPSRGKVGLAFRKYALRIFVVLVVIRLLWMLIVRLYA
jgi:hypothetical protein